MQLHVWCYLPLLVILLVLACAAGEPQPQAAIKVMSFNIRYGDADDGPDSWSFRKGKSAQVIQDYAPDIIGMQEALGYQRDELLTMLPRYGSFGVGRDDGLEAGEQCCIFYDKERFIPTASGTFWLSLSPGIPGSISWDSSLTRICSWVRFYEPATYCGFYVFNAHFDHMGEEARLESAKLVLSRITAPNVDEPVIFMGDLNCGENSAPVQLLSLQLFDTYRMVHTGETVVGTFNGFAGTTDGEKIDYVFVNEGWQVDEAAIIRDSYNGNYPSDHFPVVATVRFID